MSFIGFLIGAILMTVGFFMVYKTKWFDNNFGDVRAAIGLQGSSLAHWKFAGIILLFFGFLIAFGIFEIFFNATIGGFFRFGGS